MMAVAKKDEGPTRNFWEGEWVCADCGYLYDIDDCGGLYLEEQVRFLLLFCFFGWLVLLYDGASKYFAYRGVYSVVCAVH